MASYRFSASLIKRSTGRSAVAAAAYRSGEQLQDMRYGETHDYTRKGGVLHAEIMAPENTPAWMLERETLWNAVEAVERRKDAQLAREVQLSLPHELDDGQRVELVRQFVRDQFVAEGMIADVAIHAPHRQGDQRNHHAHVMLTLRELTGEGFGKKVRDWNDRGNIDRWREEWAQAQNLAFERAGVEARVDHRSLEAQGIDREPEQHEGPNVTAMRRRDEPSRVAEENDRRREANAERADMHAELLHLRREIERQRERFEWWAKQKQAELDSAQALTRLDQSQEHDRAASQLEDRLADFYGQGLRTVKAEARATAEQLDIGGWRGFLRKLTGREEADRHRLEQLKATIRDTERRMQEARDRLRRQQEAELARLRELQAQRRKEQELGLERARERKAEELKTRQQDWWQRHRTPEQDNSRPSSDWSKAQKPKDRGHEPER